MNNTRVGDWTAKRAIIVMEAFDFVLFLSRCLGVNRSQADDCVTDDNCSFRHICRG